MTIAPAGRKLGWIEAPPDPRTLRLAAYTTPDLPPPPLTANWLRRVDAWPLYHNDQVGDCVLASCAHLIQGWTTYAGKPAIIADDDVLAAYTAVSGYDPGTGTGDNGCRSLDALNLWRKAGIGGRRVVAYTRVNHRDHAEVRTALHLFGGVLVAAQLPIVADNQFRQGKAWTPGVGPASRRGSWGGHAFHVGAYDPRGLTGATWGRTQRMTWGWFDTYVAEVWALVSPDWVGVADGRSPLGLDLATMLADLRRITT